MNDLIRRDLEMLLGFSWYPVNDIDFIWDLVCNFARRSGTEDAREMLEIIQEWYRPTTT